jgi:diguanylate cyclase (GGDEF)-like protein
MEAMVHTPTLLLINTLLFMTLALCLGSVARRDRSDGLFHWGAALWVHSAAYVLFMLRGAISDWASVVLANALLAATFALMLEGLRRFYQMPPRHWLDWTPVVVVLLGFALLLDNIQARVVFGTLMMGVQLVQVVGLVIRRGSINAGRGQYFLVGAFAVFGFMLLGRLLVSLLGEMDITTVKDSNHVQAATFMVASVTMVLASFGMVVMTRDQADARNRVLALQDELTGLSNRRAIQQLLNQQIAAARRGDRTLALLMIDVDHFKRINDTYGHLSGDQALRDVAACLHGRLRAQDIMGRWGGEEFIAILPDTDEAGALALAEALRVATQQGRFVALDGQPIAITISIGVHLLERGPAGEGDTMIGAADRALYLAKERGRNRVELL